MHHRLTKATHGSYVTEREPGVMHVTMTYSCKKQNSRSPTLIRVLSILTTGWLPGNTGAWEERRQHITEMWSAISSVGNNSVTQFLQQINCNQENKQKKSPTREIQEETGDTANQVQQAMLIWLSDALKHPLGDMCFWKGAETEMSYN